MSRIRRGIATLSWRQLVMALAGLGVIAAMVVIAQAARHDETRHERVAATVGRVWARSEELGALSWQGVATWWSGGRAHVVDSAAFIRRGYAIYSALSGDLRLLRESDASSATRALLVDSGNLVAVGEKTLSSGGSRSLAPLWQTQTALPAVLGALERDALADAAAQQRTADRASTRAGVAYIGSLLIGLALLLLLGFQLHRIRRRSLLVEERRAGERRTEQRIRSLVENASDVITVLDPGLTVRWQSPTVERALGRSADALLDRRVTELVHPGDVQLLESQLASAISKPGPVTFTARFRHANGEWRHLEVIAENRLADAAVEGVVLSARDVSERKALEDALRHQALHDALTGLANRALFEDRLAHSLAAARRHGSAVAVLFLDLDDFKMINDSLGHASGDELLRAVSIRIAGVVRATDTPARLGGDEFAILLEILDDAAEADEIAARVLESLASPFSIAHRELRISASIGLARSSGSLGVDELLRDADTAMYAAKEAGKGRIEAFQEGMHERVLDRLELIGEMQHGLERDEFELDYQPIVELHDGHIIATEALVRWAHPSRGRLAPGQFIDLAEDTGLIVPLGEWILNTACAQAARWQREFPGRNLYMAVNVSTRQLHDPCFTDTVTDALRASGLDPNRLVLEITESLLPEDNDEIIRQLHTLKALGLRIAVDDFGTGYSALSRLEAYPVEILKIDRSFIDGLEHDPGRAELVRGIVNLAGSLHLSVVAEGIEQPEQADRLRHMQSPLGQGYLFSRPVSANDLHALLERNQRHADLGLTETMSMDTPPPDQSVLRSLLETRSDRPTRLPG